MHDPERPKSFPERMLRTVLASRFLTISALIHLLIVVLFGGKVLFNKYVEPPDFQAPPGDSFVQASLDNAPPPPTPQDALPPAPTVSSAPPPPSAPAAALSTITSMSTAPSAFSMPISMAPPTLSKEIGAAPAQQAFGNGTLPSLPGAMSGRGGGAREGTGARFGEGNAAEAAVMRALRWLQSQQQTDGFWGPDGYKGAMTGLALLCFLGHGETPATSHEFGLVVSKGIDALADYANAHDSNFGFAGANFGSNPAAYQHAICVYALSEAYTMTKNPKLVPIIQRAATYILDGQCPSGGWYYNYSKANPNGGDTSVSGWQIQALKAAHLTGIAGLDRIPTALNKAITALDLTYNPQNGSYGYRSPGDADSRLTGVGVLCKLFWLGRVDKTVRGGIKDIKTKYKKLDYDAADCDLYSWYYDTQACFQMQGDTWDWWNHQFQDILVNKQSADGSWPPHAGTAEVGGFNDTSISGLTYRTTLCTLMLEVFYRYLPTTKESGSTMDDL